MHKALNTRRARKLCPQLHVNPRRGLLALRESRTVHAATEGSLLDHDSLVFLVACPWFITRDLLDRRNRLLRPTSTEYARHASCTCNSPDRSRDALVGMDTNSPLLPRGYPQDAPEEA